MRFEEGESTRRGVKRQAAALRRGDDGPPLAAIGGAIIKAASSLDREINVKRDTPESFIAEQEQWSKFLIGSEDVLPVDQRWFFHPEMQARIAEAEADFREGRFFVTETLEEAGAPGTP